MPVKLIVVDDNTAALPLAENSISAFPQFLLDRELSQPIRSFAAFERLEQFLLTFPENLVIVLDLRLELIREHQKILQTRYPDLIDLSGTVFDGLCLAAGAISNPNQRDLLIIIATTQEIGSILSDHIDDLVAKGPNSKRITYEIHGQAIVPRYVDPDRRKANAVKIFSRAATWAKGVVSPDPAVYLLARDLFHAEGHPTTIHDIPSKLFPELWWSGDDLLDSFKALYCVDRDNLEGFAEVVELPRRPVVARVVQHVLAFLNIQLKLDGIDLDEEIQLPVQPGLLFILNLAHFLGEMKIGLVRLGKVAKTYELRAPLESPEIFRHAVLTGSGREGVRRFHRLIACSSEILVKSLEKDSSENQQRIRDEWPPRPFSAPNPKDSHIFRALLDWNSNEINDMLTLRWQENLPTTK